MLIAAVRALAALYTLFTARLRGWKLIANAKISISPFLSLSPSRTVQRGFNDNTRSRSQNAIIEPILYVYIQLYMAIVVSYVERLHRVNDYASPRHRKYLILALDAWPHFCIVCTFDCYTTADAVQFSMAIELKHTHTHTCNSIIEIKASAECITKLCMRV